MAAKPLKSPHKANPTFVSAFYDKDVECYIATLSDGSTEEVPVKTVSDFKWVMNKVERVAVPDEEGGFIVRPKTISQAAVEVLRQTDNPAVMHGDSHLLHEINKRMGRPPRGIRTEKLVLDALSRNPGILRIAQVRLARSRYCRIFYVPECYPHGD